MGAWFVNSVLPGVIASLISVAPALWIQQVLLRRHFRQVTDQQTAELRAAGILPAPPGGKREAG